MARLRLHAEADGHCLSAGDLVHDVYLRLNPADRAAFHDSAHFAATAAATMRHVLVDHARKRLRAKRGGNQKRIELHSRIAWTRPRSVDLLALDEAIEQLAKLSERQVRIVELRFFGGLSVDEVARVLAVSPRTVDGEWSMARAWLRKQLRGEAKTSAP